MGRLLYRRFAPLRRIAACALCALPASLVPARGQTPARPAPVRPAVSAEPPALDLRADVRLSAPVTLNVRSETLAACLDTVSRSTGVQMQVSPALAGRRVTLYTAQWPLRNLMTALAETAHLSWRGDDAPAVPAAAVPKGTGSPANMAGYSLYQTETQRTQEQKWIAASENRAQYYRTAKSAAVQEAVRQAVAARQDGKPSFADLLAAYTPDQIRRASDLAAEPMGVISAGDQSHFHSHLIYAAPFAGLPPAAQSSVAALLNHPGYKSSPGSAGHYAPAMSNLGDLAQSQVGLIAAEGQVRLGVVPPDGKDVWVSPFDVVRGGGVADADNASGAAPELVTALGQGEPLDLRRMPSALRKKRLRFGASAKRTELPAILESVALQTGLNIVADDFLQSDTTPYNWLLGDGLEVTLEDALTQIAKAYGHYIAYRDGGLRAWTLTPGLDLRSEPPADLLTRLRALTKTGQTARLPDYIALGGLSQTQTDLLAMRQIPDVGLWLFRSYAQRFHGVLHLYALLSPDERLRAESGRGFAIRDMSARQRRAFEEVASVGLPARAGAADRFAQSGLYVERKGTPDKAETVSFHLAADASPIRVISYRLPIR